MGCLVATISGLDNAAILSRQQNLPANKILMLDAIALDGMDLHADAMVGGNCRGL
jgi:hypothetical protein